MADIFLKNDTKNLLQYKFVLMVGDSNMRSLYLDLIYLSIKNEISPPDLFRKTRGGNQLQLDKMVRISPLEVPGRDMFEEREYKDDIFHFRFHFITKAYGREMQLLLRDIQGGSMPVPHILIMNSCLWDLSRWGAMREGAYRAELVQLFGRLRQLLPDDTLTIWCTTLPLSVDCCKGGIIIQQLEFVKATFRFQILEANQFCQQLCKAFGVDLLDLHYHMRFQLHRRALDGIHWETHAYRHMICLILTHIAVSYNSPLPGHVENNSLKEIVRKANTQRSPALSDLGLNQNAEKRVRCELNKPTAKISRKQTQEEAGAVEKRWEADRTQRKRPLNERITMSAKRRIGKGGESFRKSTRNGCQIGQLENYSCPSFSSDGSSGSDVFGHWMDGKFVFSNWGPQFFVAPNNFESLYPPPENTFERKRYFY